MTDTIEREAKLFEAGSYPDRGVEVTEDDLDTIARNTTEAPVRIEHTATPFDGALGVLKSVYRRGRELFGRLCFTRAAWEFIQSANARRLSVAITREKTGITEVSLVREPRVADAAVFGGGVFLPGEIDLEAGCGFSQAGESEVARLQRELAERDTQIALDELKRQGKIVPASEAFARAILRIGDESVITFGDQPVPISQVFRWFLDSQPKVVEFGELAAADEDALDEPEVFAKLGVTTRQVEKHRSR